ncbi:MAG: carbon monoxide dehydrogenase accessory protein CooC [Thermodesulfobacteriota bacterium]|nr:carbon monoxide dehydrogenase accessory protein CooC [Thermodesulfobacteriota bacterium]
MKIAVTGKGGVGKTTFTACLSKKFHDDGYSVLAIDADPNANLAMALGFPDPEKITPIAEMSDLIEERTGAKPGTSGSFFVLNPKVDDIPEKYWVEHNGIRLMIMGTVKKGGSGCVCPESVLLRTLVSHLILARKEVIILDMEAGVEHLGRATAKAVDILIIVVEPGKRSIETAFRIKNLARDIGIESLGVIVNKVRNEKDEEFITGEMVGFNILGSIPSDPLIIEADLKGIPPFELSPGIMLEMEKVKKRLEG